MPHPYARVKRATPNLNAAEKRLIAAESLRLMKEDGGLSRIDAVRNGMKVLDKARQKPIPDMAHAKWIIPLWEEIAAERDAMNGETEAPLPGSAEFPSMNELPVAVAALPAEDVGPTPPSEADTPPVAPVKKANGVPKGTKMVRWTGAERQTVAKGFLKLKADFPDMKDIDCLRKSMQYNLPDNRQRKVISANEPWLKISLDEVRAEAEREIHSAHEQREAQLRAEQEALEAEREREAFQRAEADRLELEKAEACDRAVAEYRESLGIEDLLLLVAKKAAGVMIGSLVDTPQTQVMAQIGGASRVPMTLHMPGVAPVRMEPDEVVAQPAPRDRKPRVLVIGLQGKQPDELERAMSGRVKLDFVKVEHTGGSAIAEKARHADLVVLMTKWISHSHQTAAKQANANVVHRNGSVTDLKRWLTSWINGEIALAA